MIHFSYNNKVYISCVTAAAADDDDDDDSGGGNDDVSCDVQRFANTTRL